MLCRLASLLWIMRVIHICLTQSCLPSSFLRIHMALICYDGTDEPHDLFEQALPSVQTRLRDFTALPLFDLPLRGIGKPVGMTSRRCFSTTSSRGQASKDELSRSLTHLTATGDARMVDITHKSATHRVAVAIGRVVFSTSQPASLIPAALMKKGDVLATARIAAIMAAKQTASLIPLCHPIGGPVHKATYFVRRH